MGDAYAVILVGGRGKRLRPLSTNSGAKAFLSITKDRKTMFRKTLDRIEHIIPRKNIIVVANKLHASLVKKDFPSLPEKNLVLEPVSRNTAPAITLVAAMLQKKDEQAVMAVFPSDHYIRDEKKQLDSVRRAIRFAKENKDALVVLGIKPEHPATGFGYIKAAGRISGAKAIYKVEKFIEKPDLRNAKKFIKNKSYLWNTGVFVFRVDSIIDAVKRFAPEIYRAFAGLGMTALKNIYNKLPGISIDYAVMTKADNMYCVKGAYRWSDIGSFEALKSALKRESRDFVERDGKILRIL